MQQSVALPFSTSKARQDFVSGVKSHHAARANTPRWYAAPPMNSVELSEFTLRPLAFIRSEIATRSAAPRQGNEGAPDAWLEIVPSARAAARGLAVGDEIILITWLHAARRDVLEVHPRGNPEAPLTGVFATRSPDRPNPLGLHPVVIRAIEDGRLLVGPLEAIDGTPVVDVKPVLKG